MPSYRIAKTAELDILFDWLADQLRQLRQSNPDHRIILDYLDQQYNHAETKLALLQTLLALKDPNFDKRADKLAHDLSRYIVPTANHYSAVNALIAQHLPNIPRYTKMPVDLTSARSVKAGIELEDLANAGVTILFEAPNEFSAWQQSSRVLIA